MLDTSRRICKWLPIQCFLVYCDDELCVFCFFPESRLSPIVSDIKLETEDDYGSDDDISNFDTRYQPKHALKKAICDWLEEFRQNRLPPRTVAIPIPGPKLPVPDDLPSCDNLETTVIPTSNTTENPSYLQPNSTVLANSLVDPVISSEKKDSDIESDSDLSVDSEPMDYVPTDNPTALPEADNSSKIPHTDDSMQVEPEICDCPKQEHELKSGVNNNIGDKCGSSVCLYYDEVDLLINLFYLPFEYGSRPLHLLHELYWLRSNAYLVSNKKDKKGVRCCCLHRAPDKRSIQMNISPQKCGIGTYYKQISEVFLTSTLSPRHF